jgi:hypothetical protein
LGRKKFPFSHNGNFQNGNLGRVKITILPKMGKMGIFALAKYHFGNSHYGKMGIFSCHCGNGKLPIPIMEITKWR